MRGNRVALGGSGAGMRTKTVWAYLALALVAAGTHWLLPDPGSRAAAWDLLGTLAVALAAVGITRNRPDDRRPWIFLAIGLALFVAGDIVWDLSSQVFGEPQSFIPQSDVVYLSAYPFFAVGLLRIAQHRRGGRAALLDGGVVAIALSAPLWTFVIRPVLDHAPRSSLDRVITIAYPLMDVVLLVIVAYTVFTLPRWNPAAMLLIGGLMVNMAADILYARFTIIGTEESTPWLDPLWPASYALLAAAFLHPAMRELTQSTAEGRQEHDRGRIGILILALFAFPTTFIIEAITGERVGSEFLSITSIVISSLVVWRLVSLVRDSARAHDRLSASEQRFRALVQNASDAVAVTGTEGELLYVSPGAERLLGRS